MPSGRGQSDALATVEFIRRARRVRAVWRSDATRVHAGLRNLIVKNPVAANQSRSLHPRRIDWSQSPLLGNRAPRTRDFADQVAHQLVGTLLSWSDRQALLRSATALGIAPFEANLIIAAVQQHLTQSPRQAKTAANSTLYPSRRWAGLAGGIAIFLTVQAMIVLAGWHLLS